MPNLPVQSMSKQSPLPSYQLNLPSKYSGHASGSNTMNNTARVPQEKTE